MWFAPKRVLSAGMRHGREPFGGGGRFDNVRRLRDVQVSAVPRARRGSRGMSQSNHRLKDQRPPQTKPVSLIINHDILCRGCGYNLRGQTGDPVRCPECGGQIDLREAYKKHIQTHLRSLQATPAVAVCLTSMMAFCVPSGRILVCNWINGRDNSLDMFTIGLVFLSMPILGFSATFGVGVTRVDSVAPGRDGGAYCC